MAATTWEIIEVNPEVMTTLTAVELGISPDEVSEELGGCTYLTAAG